VKFQVRINLQSLRTSLRSDLKMIENACVMSQELCLSKYEHWNNMFLLLTVFRSHSKKTCSWPAPWPSPLGLASSVRPDLRFGGPKPRQIMWKKKDFINTNSDLTWCSESNQFDYATRLVTIDYCNYGTITNWGYDGCIYSWVNRPIHHRRVSCCGKRSNMVRPSTTQISMDWLKINPPNRELLFFPYQTLGVGSEIFFHATNSKNDQFG
jgi:hypothetical protein